MSYLTGTFRRRYRSFLDGYFFRGNVNEKTPILVGVSLLREMERERRHTLDTHAQQAIADLKTAASAETEQLVVNLLALIHVPLPAGSTGSRRTSFAIGAYRHWREAMDAHLEQARQIRAAEAAKHPVWRRKSFKQTAALILAVAGAMRFLRGSDNVELAVGVTLMLCSLILLMDVAFGSGYLVGIIGTALLGVNFWQSQAIGAWAGGARPWSTVAVLLLFGVFSVLAERSVPREPSWRRAHRRKPYQW
jgi:hypothetical protein